MSEPIERKPIKRKSTKKNSFVVKKVTSYGN